MHKDTFSDLSPGHLEPTSFIEHWITEEGLTAQRVKGWGFVPDPLPPAIELPFLLSELFNEIVAAERSLSALDASGRRVENPHLLTGIFAQREAILSSQIENTFASATEIRLVDLAPSLLRDDKKRNEAREVRNYIRALNHGLASELPVSVRLIKQMHAVLLDGVSGQGVQPGAFRTTQNVIGDQARPFAEAKFVPPPPQYLQECLRDFEKYCHVADSKIPRLVRFALLHYQFETIHPFLDGNGRIGRLLITMMLCAQAQLSKPLVYVSGYFEKNRETYYQLLHEVSTHGRWHEWIAFFLRSISTQADDALQRTDRLIDLQTRFQQTVREKRASALLPALVDHLFTSPVITASEAAQACDCTPQNASQLINRLVEKQILVEVSGRASARIYEAPQITDLIMN